MIPRRFFWLFDIIVLAIAFLAAYWLVPRIHPLFTPGGPLRTSWIEALAPIIWSGYLPPLTKLLWVFLIIAPTTLMVLGMLGNHGPLLYQSRTHIAVGSMLSPMAGLSLVALVLFALKSPDWSRLLTFSFTGLGGVGLCLYRLVLRRYFLFRQAAGYYAKNVLLVGLPPALEWMAHYFAEDVPAVEYRLIGYLRARPDQPPPNHSNGKNGATVADLTPLGDVEALGDLLINRPVHEVIAIHPASGGKWIEQVIRDCDYFGVLLRVVPEALLLGERQRLQTLYPFEMLHLPAVVLTPPYLDSDAFFFKRLFDMAASATLLILLSPLLLLIALAIKITTPHLPAFYRWRVVGRNGVEFTGYKFTTMDADRDARKVMELMPYNEMNGPVFKMKDDPRVTPLGRFLRKYSLNELPQLWSVLKGDMSLVGPRPAFRHELERYEFWHKRKLSIRPGITCLWQVRGRNKINDFDDWVKMDLEYIDNWSLWLDLRILVRTAWVVVAGTGS